MTDNKRVPEITIPGHDNPDDPRSDIEQAVEARADAVARGEGGTEPDGEGGEGGADGRVKNQDEDQQ